MNFNHYFSNQEIEILLQDWAKRYPGLIQIQSIGSSYEKRPIWQVTITNTATGPDLEKPAIWLDGNIHATELAGATTVLFITNALLEGYGKDERITRILDTAVVYAVPRVNPDGAAMAMAAQPRYLRSGVRPYPWEDLLPGLHEQDINGDGHIRFMRFTDPNGDWKIHGGDARMMEKRAPDENGGEYYRVLPEGLIEDYDGDTITLARPRQSLDFNRNFPYSWRPEAEQEGAGDFPASEPEIRAVTEFVARHPNINAALAFHTYGRLLLRPYSTRPDDELNYKDLWLYQKIGALGTRLTGYGNVSTYHDFRFTSKEMTYGAFDDWIFDQFGVISFTVELWSIALEAGVKIEKLMEWYREHPVEDDLTILNLTIQNTDENAFADWEPFIHPQLGEVEVGGWDTLYTWRNPPPALMQNEAARHLPFALALADMLPLIQIHKLEVIPAGADSWLVRLVVDNSGYLPTFTTQQAKSRAAVRPVRAEICLPEGARLAAGKRTAVVGHLEGRSNKLSTFVYESSPTDNRGRVEWLVHAKDGTTIEVRVMSERAGTVRQTVTLENPSAHP